MRDLEIRRSRHLPLPRPTTARAGLLAVLLATGCGTGTSSINDFCPGSNSQGGNPVGNWTVHASCQVPYVRTYTADWCSQLVYNNLDQGVKDGLFLGQEFLPLTSGTVSYRLPDLAMGDSACGDNCGYYTAALVFSGMTTTRFPLACLQQHMAVGTGAKLQNTCDDLQVKIKALAENVLPLVQNLQCLADSDGGCSCSYLVTNAAIAPDVGSWRVENNLLFHYPSLLTQAGAADFAVGAHEMHLHGHDGTSLLAHDPLRNLDLIR
jgi:hypothetical protein